MVRQDGTTIVPALMAGPCGTNTEISSGPIAVPDIIRPPAGREGVEKVAGPAHSTLESMGDAFSVVDLEGKIVRLDEQVYGSWRSGSSYGLGDDWQAPFVLDQSVLGGFPR